MPTLFWSPIRPQDEIPGRQLALIDENGDPAPGILLAAAAGAPLARNSAKGPSADTPIGQTPVLTNVPWTTVESTGAAGASVPITPVLTGKVRISGVVQIASSGEVAADHFNVAIVVDAAVVVVVASDLQVPLGDGKAFLTVPFDTVVSLSLALHTVQIGVQSVIGASVNYILPHAGNPTFVDVQELTAATG